MFWLRYFRTAGNITQALQAAQAAASRKAQRRDDPIIVNALRGRFFLSPPGGPFADCWCPSQIVVPSFDGSYETPVPRSSIICETGLVSG